MPDQRLFAGQSQPARRSSAGNDQGARVDGFLAQTQRKGTHTKIGADHVAKLVLGAESPRLLAHVLDQLRPLDAIRKSRKIFHQGSQRELASGFMAFEHQRLQFGARRVERRGVTGATRADDDNVANILHKRCQALDCGSQIWMQAHCEPTFWPQVSSPWTISASV